MKEQNFHETLFNVLCENINKFDLHKTTFLLMAFCKLNGDTDIQLNHKIEIEGTIEKMYKYCKRLLFLKGYDFVISALQIKSNYYLKHSNKSQSEIEQLIFDSVTETYGFDKSSLYEHSYRDGLRVFASGTMIFLFNNYANLKVNEIAEILDKQRWNISNHKNKILNLDWSHPTDNKILQKHLKCVNLFLNKTIN